MDNLIEKKLISGKIQCFENCWGEFHFCWRDICYRTFHYKAFVSAFFCQHERIWIRKTEKKRGGSILYWGFSGDSSWCRIRKKSWCIYLFFVNKHVLKITAYIKYKMIGIVVVLIVLIIVLCSCIIHANNKYSA